jgi:hypothetical protein
MAAWGRFLPLGQSRSETRFKAAHSGASVEDIALGASCLQAEVSGRLTNAEGGDPVRLCPGYFAKSSDLWKPTQLVVLTPV